MCIRDRIPDESNKITKPRRSTKGGNKKGTVKAALKKDLKGIFEFARKYPVIKPIEEDKIMERIDWEIVKVRNLKNKGLLNNSTQLVMPELKFK